MSRFRPRFSLLTTLLLMTIVGLSIAMWRTYLRLTVITEEVLRLRAEMGHVFVTDPDKVHAIQVRQAPDSTVRWRLHFPPGRSYQIRCCSGVIPPQGRRSVKQWLKDVEANCTSTNGIGSNLLQGEVTLDTKLVHENGEWYLDLSPISRVSVDVTGNRIDDPRARYVWGMVGVDKQRVFDHNEPILLQCIQQGNFRPMGSGFSIGPPSGPVDSIVLWIEENP